MPKLKHHLRRIRRAILRLKSRLASQLIDRLRDPNAFETISTGVVYRLVLWIYFLKRLLQDVVQERRLPGRRALRHRFREVETNFLTRLIVWRDWPLDRDFNLYEAYRANNVLIPEEKEAMRLLAATWVDPPLISIVVPVFNASLSWIERLVDSILDQVYDRWELVLVDDGSTNLETWSALVRAADRDERIAIHRLTVNKGVVQATNEAIGLSSGRYVAFVDHDDELFADALWWVARSLRGGSVDVVYTDEEIYQESSGDAHPQIKPGFSPELLRSYNYICHLLVVRRSLLERVGRLRLGTEGAQDYDLVLRLMEATDRFVHVPRVLYRWRVVSESLSRRTDAQSGEIRQTDVIDPITSRVVGDHFARTGIDAKAEIHHHWVRAKYSDQSRGRVSIIICTKDNPILLGKCVESIEAKTHYRDYEIVIVDNDSRTSEARRVIDGMRRRHRVVRIQNADDGFSFSRLNNLAALLTDAPFLLFLNDDTEVLTEAWLSALVGQLDDPLVAVTGARLLYPNGRNQHAGLVVGALGWGPWHALIGVPADWNGAGGYMTFPHNCSAVTGACLLTRRETFLGLGGFDEKQFAVSFNDVDYCLRIRERGGRIAYAPQAELIHAEGASRGHRARPSEVVAMRNRWIGYRDPYWNEAYSRKSPHFSLGMRRRSRGLGVVPRPRVLFVEGAGVRASDFPTASAILDRLQGQGKVEFTCVADWNENPASRRSLREFLESGEYDLLLAEGEECCGAIELASEVGVVSLWHMPRRPMLPRGATALDRAKFLRVVEALDLPYQVLFSDPYSIGWMAAGLPRPNLELVARPGWDKEVTEHVEVAGLRESLGISRSALVIHTVLSAEESDSLEFLVDCWRQLPCREKTFLLVGIDGYPPPEFWSRGRTLVARSGPGLAIVPANAVLLGIAAIYLSHSIVDPRSAWLIQALGGRVPMVGTPLVEQGDLLHSGASGLCARSFDRTDWVGKITRLVEEQATRVNLGLQGRFWLESRESADDIVADWGALVVESAELGRVRAGTPISKASTSDFDRSGSSVGAGGVL